MGKISSYFLRIILLFVGLIVVVRLYAADNPSSAGTGFVVNPDGYLLTCEHVVRDAGKIQVTIGAKSWDAAVISVDKVHDLALIQIPVKGLIALPLANSNAIEVGQEARAFGFPLSFELGEDLKVTRGTVAGISMRDAQKIIQVDTAVNAGNSGGPLVNEKGEVLGVVNAKIVGVTVTDVAFSVPINYAKQLLVMEAIKFSEEGAKEKLDGPTLVKHISSSVGLITIWNKTPSITINSKDGAELILIPSGEFLMGSAEDDKLADNVEKPQHKVYVDTYYIYKTEVTVGQYRKFCLTVGKKMPDAPGWGWIDNNPIVNVSWNDAKAYAEWAGVKLPTEAQWEKAARGTDGRIYPWGNKWDESKSVNKTNSKNRTQKVGNILSGASPYGCLDMVGNVWEWCSDWYSNDYYELAPMKNPVGPWTGTNRVMKGGSWGNFYGGDCSRCACRTNGNPGYKYDGVGFRCVSPGI